MRQNKFTRREVVKLSGLASASLLLPMNLSFTVAEQMIERKIPTTGDRLPIVGIGTWQTFDINFSSSQLKTLKAVLKEMYNHGGRVIDSSPMYGNSEEIVGNLTEELRPKNDFFYATKVWTIGKESAERQIQSSMAKMRRKKMDLIQIHNLIDYKTHVKTLKNFKNKELIKYWGITHYIDGAHSRLERIIKAEKPDFVQFNYSIVSRHAEKSLFNTIRENRTAVIINRPFEGGLLFRKIKGKQLPEWTKEYNINSWGQFFLKFILSNELVTCVIPGTSKLHHVIDNMHAGFGKVPDKRVREEMCDYLKKL